MKPINPPLSQGLPPARDWELESRSKLAAVIGAHREAMLAGSRKHAGESLQCAGCADALAALMPESRLLPL